MSIQVFDGLHVADFSWVGVGPITIRYLADFGATVVHVESGTHPDVLRLAPPFKDGTPGLDRSGFFADFNASKYGMSLNLNHPRGREVALRLIAWADVVAESYVPGTMRKWGLDYECVRQWKPDVIYFSTCQQGQTGPLATQPGYGTQLVSLAGFTDLTGWPDRTPAGPYGAYTDFVNPRFGVAALVGALLYRRRTGRGLHLDLSQLEGGLQFLAPLLLDYQVNGRTTTRMGNRDPLMAPHGAYPCLGDDRWIAIAVEDDAQWMALCGVMGRPGWTRASRLAAFEGRKAHEDDLDAHIGEWTRTQKAEELMETLQVAGVPAGVVQTAQDLFADPQLRHRGHFTWLEHREMGRCAYDGPAFRLSKTPGAPRMPAPCLGEHNAHVYREVLGYSDEEVAQMVEDGVME
ncbi:MAG: CoA transferase [Chloroflexi bacterium]|nr:CoA transferase [Chloroflexota bacterium]